jgi:hypothetical protein
MNKLVIGLAEKHFEYPKGSLVITDEPILKRGTKLFDPAKHGLNPLPMQYREAREFAASVFPDKDLMTYRNGRRALTRLVMKADRLDRLEYTRDDDDQEAKGVVEDILLSPLLRTALSKPIPRWFYSGATIKVRLNRKEIGDEDARLIASILISQFKGPIVIEDFGFYARPFHTSLIREDRLMAGVFTLSELDEKLRQMCLLMQTEGVGCTYDDAALLAKYAGHVAGTNAFNAFVKQAMAI